MDREHCRECELLKDLYWLKVNRLLLALKVEAASQGAGSQGRQEESLARTKQETLRALDALVAHLRVCYARERVHEAWSQFGRCLELCG